MDPSAGSRLVQKATPDDTESRKNDVLQQGMAEGAYFHCCHPSVQRFNRIGLAVKSYSCIEEYNCKVVMKTICRQPTRRFVYRCPSGPS